MTDEIKGFKPQPPPSSLSTGEELSPSEGFPDPYKDEPAVVIATVETGVAEARNEVQRLEASVAPPAAKPIETRPRPRQPEPRSAGAPSMTPESPEAAANASPASPPAEPSRLDQPIRSPEAATALANDLRGRIAANPPEAIAASANATAAVVRSLYS